MYRPKVILINAPLGAGKTELAKEIEYEFFGDITKNPIMLRCKDRLHELTYTFFNVDVDKYFEIYNHRPSKEEPREEFKVTVEAALNLRGFVKFTPHIVGEYVWLSLRLAMIYVSEVITKPAQGLEAFGRWRVEEITKAEKRKSTDSVDIFIEDSCGFYEECLPLLDIFTDEEIEENVLLVYIEGRGEFLNSDSRKKVPNVWEKNGRKVTVPTLTIQNTSSFEYFLETGVTQIKNHLTKEKK